MIQEAKLEQFTTGLLTDLFSALHVVLAHLGNVLGLWEAAADGPFTACELARRAEVDPGFVGEWLRTMALAGYLEVGTQPGLYVLPTEHAMVLTGMGPSSFAGFVEAASRAVAGADNVALGLVSGSGPQADLVVPVLGAARRAMAAWTGLDVAMHCRPLRGARTPVSGRGSVVEVGLSGVTAAALVRANPGCSAVVIAEHGYAPDEAAQLAHLYGVEGRVHVCLAEDPGDLPTGPFELAVVEPGDPDHQAQGRLTWIRQVLELDGVCLMVLPISSYERVAQTSRTRLLWTLATACGTPGSDGDDEPLTKELLELAQRAGFRSATPVHVESALYDLFELRP